MIKWLLFGLFLYFIVRLIRSLLRVSGFIQGINDTVNQNQVNSQQRPEKDITSKVRRID